MPEHRTVDQKQLDERFFGFPQDLTYTDYLGLDPYLRERIALVNPIIQTDTYNRTMEHIFGPEWDTPSTYCLQFRRSKAGYLVVYGVGRAVHDTVARPVTQSQLDFASDYYADRARVPFFNREKWQEVIDNHDGYVPLSIEAVPDGTVVLPGDPVLRVSGPGEFAAHFEPGFHRVFYQTMIATNAHQISQIISPDQFIEAGKRGTPLEELHMMALEAAYVGGGIHLTSNDAAAATYTELDVAGTIGHRYLQAFFSEREAFETAIQRLDAVALLIDLVDSYKGIDLAIELKEKYRRSGKHISMRLDSGDIIDQTIYALSQMRSRGMEDPKKDKVIIADISDIDQLRQIVTAVREAGFDPSTRLQFVAGGMLVANNTSRSDASSGYKITRYGTLDTMKFSDTPAKQSIPGVPTLVQTADGRRLIGQAGEGTHGHDLFVPVYANSKVLISHDMQRARSTVGASYATVDALLKSGARVSEASPETATLIRKVQDRYRR